MLNLYWKAGESIRALAARPFASEDALERYIYANQELLGGDIYIIQRQIRTGTREGIPDMIGVDQDGRVCIIELKNTTADESVLPQALGYAIWAETNPDSIKAIWLEARDRPEEMSIDWDNMDVRVILIAPGFRPTVSRMAVKIGYDIDLFQVQRYCLDDDEFILVELLEQEPRSRVTMTRGKGEWDWDYYRSEYGQETTLQVKGTVEALDAFFCAQGWDLPHNLNKRYVGFKLENRLVALVRWRGSSWSLQLRLPRSVTDDWEGTHWRFYHYNPKWKTAEFQPVKPDNANIEEIKPLLQRAYDNVAGNT